MDFKKLATNDPEASKIISLFVLASQGYNKLINKIKKDYNPNLKQLILNSDLSQEEIESMYHVSGILEESESRQKRLDFMKRFKINMN